MKTNTWRYEMAMYRREPVQDEENEADVDVGMVAATEEDARRRLIRDAIASGWWVRCLTPMAREM